MVITNAVRLSALIFLLAIAPLALASWTVGDSRYFQGCVGSHGTEVGQQQQAASDHATAVRVAIPSPVPVSGLPLYKRCIGGFVFHFNAAITALATVLLGVVTGGLVWIGYLQITTSRAQLRAYMFPLAASFYDGTTVNPPQPTFAGTPSASMTIKNSGQTPAFHVQTWAEIAVIEPINEHSLVVPKFDIKFTNALGAGDTMPKERVFYRAMTASELSDVAAGVKRIYFYGRIEYDTLGRRRQTSFRLSYAGLWPPLAAHTLIYSDEGNSAD